MLVVLLAWRAPIDARLEFVPTLLAGDSADTTVYVTKTGKKYHRGTCGSLSRSKIPMPLGDAVVRFGHVSINEREAKNGVTIVDVNGNPVTVMGPRPSRDIFDVRLAPRNPQPRR